MITPDPRRQQALTPADVGAHYDELDVYYRRIWGEHVHHGYWETGHEPQGDAVVSLARRVANLARVGPGSAVCDVGCGYGATARLLARERGAQVTGVTVSGAQLAYARAHTPGENPRYLLTDWLSNDLPAGQFDAVISIESSEHMADKARFFAECARTLKPGGRLVVCAWIARSRATALEVRHLLEPICREGRLPGMGTEEEYVGLIRGAGLALHATEDASRKVKRTWALSALGIARELVRDPGALRFLVSGPENRVFAKTVLRIWAAYGVGSMRYVIFTAVKPA